MTVDIPFNPHETALDHWDVSGDRHAFLPFLQSFPDPESVAAGVTRFAQECPGELLGRKPVGGEPFLLKNPALLTDTHRGRLLHFPPGSTVFTLAASCIPWILERQLEEFFPGLPAMLEGILPGVEPLLPMLDILTSLHFEDVLTGVMGATTGVYHARFRTGAGSLHLVLKRTDMSLERVLARLLEDVLDLSAVQVLRTGSSYSIMAPVPGLSLRAMTGNPLTEPRRRGWSHAEMIRLARISGEESALAFYLGYYSRHSGNLVACDPSDLTESPMVRIDFGQSLLPSRNRWIEAIMPLWHLRRFFPGDGNDPYEDRELVANLFEGFRSVREKAEKRIGDVERILTEAVGLPIPEMEGELREPAIVRPDHVEKILNRLTSGRPAEDDFDAIYNRFYQDFWQVPGWMEYHAPRDRSIDLDPGDFDGLVSPRPWSRMQA